MVETTPATDTHGDSDGGTRGRGRRLSIIEVVAIVVVLGILAVLVAFSVNNANQISITKACTTEAQAIRVAVDSYRAKHHATDTPPMTGANSLLSDRDLLVPSSRWSLSYHGTKPIMSAVPGAGCRGTA
jgi:type II secretory pathway pseudopilin PulG